MMEARQTGHIGVLPGSDEGVSCSDIRGLASSVSGWQKGCVLRGVVCRGAGTGRFFVPPGNLLVASREPWGCCQNASR